MHSKFALVDGNLALDGSRLPQQTPSPRFETQIVDLPVSSARAARSNRAAAVAPAQALRSCPSAAPAPVPARNVLHTLAAASVLVGMLALLMFALASVLGGEANAYERALAETPLTTVSVSPGDSLWGIAAEHGAEGMTTQETTELIRTWNDLDSATLQPGTELLVPVAAS